MTDQLKTTTTVTFRLDTRLVARLRRVTTKMQDRWPPGPTQTEIAERGIRQVLEEMETIDKRRRG